MGLPGVAYWMGLADPFWTALGLGIGTYVNWRLVSTRLRSYSAITADAITIPDFFSNRFHEKKKVLMTISALFILVFFTVYASSCFVAVGKLFSSIFAIDYQACMVAGAAFVVLYTLLGGFLAESASDFMQALVMIAALVAILVVGVHHGRRAGPHPGQPEEHPGLPGILRRRDPGHGRRRPGRGQRPGAVRRGRKLFAADHPLHHVLGAGLFRHAAGAAALHGHPRPQAARFLPAHRHHLVLHLAVRRRGHRPGRQGALPRRTADARRRRRAFSSSSPPVCCRPPWPASPWPASWPRPSARRIPTC